MDTFAHIKTVIGIILSISIALLLQGTVKLGQLCRHEIVWR
jgi:hypothetical protein